MDYVVGNPPYVRVHNLDDSYTNVKKFNFAQNGMTDLYIVFFEVGFSMLNDNGKMCLISPSSFLNSLAGVNLRKYIKEKQNLVEIIDLEHFQPFEKITTYTVISLFNKKKNSYVKYYRYDIGKRDKYKLVKINYDDLFIDGKIFLAEKSTSNLLKSVFNGNYKNIVEVKNGFATLSDKIFIKENFDFNEMLIKIKKASTGKYYKCLYPYDENGKPLDINYIKKNYPNAYSYLVKNKDNLLSRSIKNKDEWYLFGRSQGINDTYKSKISINTTIKDLQSIKISKEKEGVAIYSGLYILTKRDYKSIEKVIKNQDFINYIKSLKKYKSGGYYTFSSKDLRMYLNYKLSK